MNRWRLQFKEAEARLAELTGDKSGDAKRLVWGVGDEERFRGELDEKVGDAAPRPGLIDGRRGLSWAGLLMMRLQISSVDWLKNTAHV